MIDLLSLPVEILSEIIAQTLPDGIEAFVLSCKSIHAVAASQIRRHKALKQTWTRCTDTAPHLLFSLFGDSEVDALAAQYVEDLDLCNVVPGNPSMSGNARFFARDKDREGDDEVSADREQLKNIKKVVTASRYLKDANVDPEKWWEVMENAHFESMDEEDRDLVPNCTISLLSLLPNLKILRLPYSWELGSSDNGVETAISVLDAMVDSSYGSGGALAKLKTIMPYHSRGYDDKTGLRDVEPFLRLKPLRELYLVSSLAIDDGYTGIPFRWRFPKLKSSLRRIELAYCCMDADEISELLEHTPELQVFKYSHEIKWHGCGYDWNAGAFVEAVADQVGSTLTELAITSDDGINDIVNGVASFHKFSKLKTLEIDLFFFCGRPVGSGETSSCDESQGEVETPWTEKEVPSLASMLPTSVTNIQLNADFIGSPGQAHEPQPHEVALGALLTGFDEFKQQNLPDLSKIVIRTFRTARVNAIVEGTGTKAEVYPESADPERATDRSELPGWLQEFDRKVGIVD